MSRIIVRSTLRPSFELTVRKGGIPLEMFQKGDRIPDPQLGWVPKMDKPSEPKSTWMTEAGLAAQKTAGQEIERKEIHTAPGEAGPTSLPTPTPMARGYSRGLVGPDVYKYRKEVIPEQQLLSARGTPVVAQEKHHLTRVSQGRQDLPPKVLSETGEDVSEKMGHLASEIRAREAFPVGSTVSKIVRPSLEKQYGSQPKPEKGIESEGLGPFELYGGGAGGLAGTWVGKKAANVLFRQAPKGLKGVLSREGMKYAAKTIPTMAAGTWGGTVIGTATGSAIAGKTPEQSEKAAAEMYESSGSPTGAIPRVGRTAWGLGGKRLYHTARGLLGTGEKEPEAPTSQPASKPETPASQPAGKGTAGKGTAGKGTAGKGTAGKGSKTPPAQPTGKPKEEKPEKPSKLKSPPKETLSKEEIEQSKGFLKLSLNADYSNLMEKLGHLNAR